MRAICPQATLMLAGDVMTGRGIDQILAHPGDPTLFESHVRSALDYVALAERAHGPIPRRVPFDYIWGDGLSEIARHRPDLTFINLETAITARGSPAPKGINYRMHPGNVGVLTAAGISAVSLANNHVLDWGRDGFNDTLDALRAAGIGAAGGGCDLDAASGPLEIAGQGPGRRLIFGIGCRDSGIPSDWAAKPARPGIYLLSTLSRAEAARVAGSVRARKRSDDIVIASIHWGGNWGFEVPAAQRTFAHALIDEGMVDVVHGHSSHHPKAIEIYRGKLILYGCGDLINDYEGIVGDARFRSDLVLMYFASVSHADGTLQSLEMVPFRVHRFRLQRASRQEADWLAVTLRRDAGIVGAGIVVTPEATLRLERT